MPHDNWRLLDSREIRDYSVLRLREDRYRIEPSGAEADFVVFDSADWVLVIPLTTDGQVVFIRQYRHAIRQMVLEVPGGIMDDGESPAGTASRELSEETGFAAAQIEIVGTLLPNPAINTARCHIALARECVRSGEPSPDPFEQIDVVLRPADEVPKMIRGGELCHALTVAAFALTGMHAD